VQVLFYAQVHPSLIVEAAEAYFASDLLVRHERLTHHKEHMDHRSAQISMEAGHMRSGSRPYKRRRSSEYSGLFEAHMSSPPTHAQMSPVQYQPASAFADVCFGQSDEFSLTTLSMAAEYQSLQGDLNQLTSSQETRELAPLPVRQTIDEQALVEYTCRNHVLSYKKSALENSIEHLTDFLENEPFSSHHFAPRMNSEQPLPFFSPINSCSTRWSSPDDLVAAFILQGYNAAEKSHTVSNIGSQVFPAQPEASRSNEAQHSLLHISNKSYEMLVERISEFSNITPNDFKLPTRLALRRYIAAYVNGFDKHMPFLHIPSISVENCSVELVLAIMAVGAQYTFENEEGIQLSKASRAIATHCIKKRDTSLAEREHRSDLSSSSPIEHTDASSAYPPYGQRSTSTATRPLSFTAETEVLGENMMQTAQALLLLMAMSSWSKHKDIFREALAIQSMLATLIREDGLQLDPLCEELPWTDWIRRETMKRTKLMVYCYFNLHCMVHNTPPLLLTSEVRLPLPCGTAEFRAPTESQWKEARKKSQPEVPFQDALKSLFSKSDQTVTETTSPSGAYVLIHALIQHIFFLRQVSRNRFDSPTSSSLNSVDTSSLESALRNWQIGWQRNPASTLPPTHPDSPLALNCNALLRLAYIHLHLDTPPRALDTRDPALIATALDTGPHLTRTPQLTHAVLHAVHALSAPIKTGYRLLSKTRSFISSTDHALCALECAYLLSKWLETLGMPGAQATDDEEASVLHIVKRLLDETEFAVPGDVEAGSPAYVACLKAGVLRVWAAVLRGGQMCTVVDVIGRALGLYANMWAPA
jgi:hypothetical protein